MAGLLKMTKAAIAVFIGAAVFMLGAAPQADAAVWKWGCKGRNASEQIIFNRDSLVILPVKALRGNIRALIEKYDLVMAFEDEGYNPIDSNSGFVKEMEFTKNDAAQTKLVLTEKSSRKISERKGRVGPRDEIYTFFRKTYRYERGNGAPRSITMECLEYVLTTKGGRK